jgi:protease-4
MPLLSVLRREENYRIKELPEKKEALQELIDDLKGDAESKIMTEHFGDSYKYMKGLDKILKIKGVQARMAFDVSYL